MMMMMVVMVVVVVVVMRGRGLVQHDDVEEEASGHSFCLTGPLARRSWALE